MKERKPSHLGDWILSLFQDLDLQRSVHLIAIACSLNLVPYSYVFRLVFRLKLHVLL